MTKYYLISKEVNLNEVQRFVIPEKLGI